MADSTRRVSVRLSLDDAARVKQELREVGETGQRSLERIQGGADRASRGLDLLNVAVRGVQIAGLAAGLRAVVVAGDALTQSMGRLNTALGSVERAGQVYEALYRNALQTGVAVSESVDAFQRFSIAAREIGATSDQVVRLVGGLQRVAIVSGASTQEISSATLQLAQALASCPAPASMPPRRRRRTAPCRRPRPHGAGPSPRSPTRPSLNTYASLIIPSTISVFAIFLFRQFFKALPDELIHAARIDGMAPWYAFPGANGVRITQAITDNTGRVVERRATPEVALADMAREVRRLLPRRS